MEKLKRHPLYRFRWILVSIPYFIALGGYIYLYFFQESAPYILDKGIELHKIAAAFYNSFKIYGLSVSAEVREMNMALEIARLTAVFATTTVIVKVIKFVYDKIRMLRMVHKPGTLMVHGNGTMKEAVLQTLGKTSIASDGELSFQAKKHVLAFDHDEEALRYIIKHENDLFNKDKKIYFLSTDYEASDYTENEVIVSNIAANCARLYWAEHWLRDSAIRRVAIIGFGDYGQHMLEQALLMNVLPWRSSIEYHIYGSDGKDYLAWHPQLKNCLSINQADEKQDSIHFHPTIIPENLNALNDLDRIILTQDNMDENLILLDHLIHMGVNGVIHIRCNKKLLAKLQYMPNRQRANTLLHVSSFGDAEQLYSEDVIINGQLLQAAKDNHRTYVSQSQAGYILTKYPSCSGYEKCHRNNGLCGDCPHAAATWDDLTPFEKASNIATADHDPIKRELLMEAAHRGGIDDCKYDLCLTEHIRWLRFYYLHNWQYNATRDDHRRHHPCLLPFEQLDKYEQDKDWWPYHLILNAPQKEDKA